MRRPRLRDQSEVLDRIDALRETVRSAEQLHGQEAVDALWRGEALGTLRWAVGLAEELPPYDEPFDHRAVAAHLVASSAKLRPFEEVDEARRTARLWHWRARTALLHAEGRLPLPERWDSLEQLVAATAMRGSENGLLPPPLRGDFPAFGTAYRQLDDEQLALALSIAAERHYALEWLCGTSHWDEVRTDT
jgi:hypothetical protein